MRSSCTVGESCRALRRDGICSVKFGTRVNSSNICFVHCGREIRMHGQSTVAAAPTVGGDGGGAVRK